MTDERGARWEEFTGWLADRLTELPVASVLDAGRAGACAATHGYDVECAQVQRLDGGRFLLRLSTTLMIIPLLDGYGAAGMELDRWYHDNLFEDCTHGYLVAQSPGLVADLVTSWFRDRCGFGGPADVGFSYMRAKTLPHTEARLDPERLRFD
ncbi:MAG: hypothetical protein QM728_11000 [Gordonia sp. (in: high G+C Gram-positive bacteria)]|uniref:hypothetical protein n=1 Tax=Gordonia sp. (in: high G+C Gram-positive bacteria) TaxID=84139 RepID=UPI0039E635A7